MHTCEYFGRWGREIQILAVHSDNACTQVHLIGFFFSSVRFDPCVIFKNYTLLFGTHVALWP